MIKTGVPINRRFMRIVVMSCQRWAGMVNAAAELPARNFRPAVKTAPMLQDRRRTQRHSVGCAAKIRFNASSQTRDCIVSDLSEDGVRLVAAGIEMPEEFVLLLDGDAGRTAGRTCRVVWRLDDEIGAEFTDSAEEGWLRMALDRLTQATR